MKKYSRLLIYFILVLSIFLNILQFYVNLYPELKSKHLLGTYIANITDSSKTGVIQYMISFSNDGKFILYGNSVLKLDGEFIKVDQDVYRLTANLYNEYIKNEEDHFYLVIEDEETMIKFVRTSLSPSYFE